MLDRVVYSAKENLFIQYIQIHLPDANLCFVE